MMHLAFHQAPRDFRASIIAAHFFNARGESIAKSTQGMYRSLLYQIFSKLVQLPSEIPSFVAASLKEHGWPIPILQNMLRTAILQLDQINESLVCYIDALDECAEDDIREAIHHFEELASLALARGTRFLICFASRHYPTITIQHYRAIDLDQQIGHYQDIADYVSSALRVSGSLGAELQRSILDRSAGVFLWAVLTVRILNKLNDHGGTRAQLRARLSEVPLGVQSLFSGILQEGDTYLLPTLQWVLFVQRPLTVAELYCAVLASVKAQPTGAWDDNEIDDDGRRRFILASSKGLVDFSNRFTHISWSLEGFLLSQESTTQLIHESLREYLLQGGLAELDPGLQRNADAIIYARLAEACQTYVSSLKRGSESNKSFSHGHSFLKHAITTTPCYMYIAFTNNAVSLEALRRFACLWLTSESVIKALSYIGRQDSATMLCLSLKKTCRRINTLDRRRMVNALTLKDVSEAAWPYKLEAQRSFHRWNHEEREVLPMFQAAVDAGSLDVLQLSRRPGWKDLFALLLPDALITAAALGLTDVLSLLLECVADATGSHRYDQTLLECAAVNLQESTIELLLCRGAKPDVALITMIADGDSWNDPTDGTEGACLSIVTSLLDAGVDVRHKEFHECVIKKREILDLLRARDASIKHCEPTEDCFKTT
jgi:hypothetical protein